LVDLERVTVAGASIEYDWIPEREVSPEGSRNMRSFDPLAAVHPVFRLGLSLLAFLTFVGCADAGQKDSQPAEQASGDSAFLDEVQARTFRFFWERSNPATGLTPDRWPTQSFDSIAATGFALTAYPIGVERGWVSREAARERTRMTMEFLWSSPQDSSIAGSTGYQGFFYHFLEPDTGLRFRDVELSTVDTALLLAGVLFCQSYFDEDHPDAERIRELAEQLYRRVDWSWASIRGPAIGHGWRPESGHLPYDWRGYNEAMLLYLLALGSPTHPVPSEAWAVWTAGYQWGEFEGQEYLCFGPLFGHQYTQVWLDLGGIQDESIHGRVNDYFENSRRAVRAQFAYAQENPLRWTGYGASFWGLSACDGPVNGAHLFKGERRSFNTYWARGASALGANDDGTIAPTAAGASIIFAPELVLPALRDMKSRYGELLYGEYGFLDALNPSFTFADVEVQHGKVHPDLGWFDTDYLGIDQGPILCMIENYRTGLIWNHMRKNPHVIRGLRRAGFTGGWLDAADAEP
jgi:hypothetical protein